MIAWMLEYYLTLRFLDMAFSSYSYAKCAMSILLLWLLSGGELLLGHELGHRKRWYHRFFGYLMYLRFMNTNYIIYHNKGHHKWVGTPLDPSSALKGETVFQFARRSIPGSLVEGWKIEANRIRKAHGQVSPVLAVLMNQVFLMKLGEVAYLCAIYYFWGLRITLAAIVLGFLVQCTL